MAEGHRLDPADWDGFGAAFHDLLDRCLARMQAARDHPWIPPPEGFAGTVALDDAARPVEALFADLAAILPHGTGNTHPRFFGWVHGAGLPQAAAAELVAATMNVNLGGRLQAATEVERAVIDWTARVAGLPQTAFGILTTGTSQATIHALSAARRRAFPRVRAEGIRDLPPVTVYHAEGAHNCIAKALEVMGHGAQAARPIPLDGAGRMDMAALAATVARDRADGCHPLAVVGTAGSVNLGLYDDFEALAAFAETEALWLHADAAFGFWSLLAEAPWRDLARGIARADSIAADFHKWIGVPYDAGICLVAEGADLKAAFAARPDYLRAGSGLAGGDVWFTDYGIELSRGFRALKVWTAIRGCGRQALGAAISDNCRQAALMGQLVEASPKLRLAHPVVSNLVCFEPLGAEADRVAAALQMSGEAVFSTTLVAGVSCLRAALVNHRTTTGDVRAAIAAVEAALT
ncbi:MAG: Glutamate decarboxylase-like protein [Rhodobacteraceae bacterium HLUCCA08]|nr:MAG: Glutamate decarboxylase-like protein [Rhodobacteraceae bacterium HLUCCA08]